MKKIFKILSSLLAVAAGLLILYVAAVYALVFLPSFSRNDPTEEINRKYFGTEKFYDDFLQEKTWFEMQNPARITIESDDGLKLVAYDLPAGGGEEKSAAGTMILMHGYQSEPVREFASLIHFYHDLGYNIILPFQRTHGESEGKFITFGVKERFDLRGWVVKANEIYGEENPVFIQGISMGCATSVMSLGLDLPSNVRGVIADCGFTSPKEIIWKVLKNDRKVPTAKTIMKIGNLFVKSFAGFDMGEYSTLDAIEFNKERANQIPILFFHGTADAYVPIEMTETNFSYCLGTMLNINGSMTMEPNPQAGKYKYVRIQDSPHAIANLIDPETYHAEVKKFLSKYGKERSAI